MSRTPAFWDSSALVPVCVHEQRSAQAQLFLRTLMPVVWWGSAVEVHGAICRLHHHREISDRDKQRALARLRVLGFDWREIVPDDHLRDLALDCLDRYALRAADAFQLAAALTWCKRRPSNRKFLTSDQRLAEAAHSTGFSVAAFP